MDITKCLHNTSHNQEPNTTVVDEGLRLKRTACDAYANCPESHYVVVWGMHV